MNATLSTMWSISALFAVQFTRSKRAGSLPSSMSILAAVKPRSMICEMNSLALGSLRSLVAGVAVDPDPVAHLAAQQLIDRQAEGFAGQIPERDLDRGERGDVLAGLRAGEDAGGANPLEERVDVQRILADQRDCGIPRRSRRRR